MMIAQPESSEDSQGRQLRVSKKLSKVISSVPRSRFQKPRPNLPGTKRPDSSSVPATARKPLEVPQKKVESSISESNTNEVFQKKDESGISESKTKEISQKRDESGIFESKINEISQKKDESGIFESKIKETFQNKETIVIELSPAKKTPEGEDVINIAVLNAANKTSEKVDRCNTELLNSTNETPEKEDDVILLNEDGILVMGSDNTPILSTNGTLKKGDSDILILDELLETGIDKSTTLISAGKTREEGDIINISLLNTTNETHQEEDNRSTLSTEPLINPPEQEKNDTINTPSSATERSSKYPHLTSILLSKKRTEPKKEVQHKRRKKFRKGDAVPERSKMTMADLIYWNPTNSEECAMKSSSRTEEIQNPVNNEEEECVDGDIAETDIIDSVPKLVLTEDGQINIDQTSLIVSRNVPQPTITQVIGKDETTYSSFRKRPLTKHWSPKDTTIFYKALSLVGTDFGLMEKIFPHRTRRELKQKFKREEKYNIDFINRAMYETQLTFDAETLEDLIEHLNNISDEALSENVDDPVTTVKVAKKRPSSRKHNTSKKAKRPVEAELNDSATESLPSEVVVSKRDMSNKRKRKNKKLPDDFIDIEDIDSIIDLSEEISMEMPQEANIEVPEETHMKVPEETHMKVPEETHMKVPEETHMKVPEETHMKVPEETHMEVSEKTNRSEDEKEKNSNKRRRIKALPNEFDQVVDRNDEFSEQNDNQEESCIAVEYVDDISSVTDSTLLENVMAYEVVTSQKPVSKKKTHVSNISQSPIKSQTFNLLQLSSTNYTPS